MPNLPLATLFAAASQRPVEATGPLDETLSALLARARAVWPGFSVGDELFVGYVAARVQDEARLARLDTLHAEDLYLACACANGVALAIEALDRRYLADLPESLRRAGVPEANAAEAVQRLRERLFVTAPPALARITEYEGRGALAGWLRVAAMRLAGNLRRDEGTRARHTRALDAPEAVRAMDPELVLLERRYAQAFNQALKDAFVTLTAEERAVLRMHFGDGLNIERIGAVLGLSRATVGRRVIAGRERLFSQSMQLLGERLNATPDELQSLLGALRSKLEVSLTALLSQAGSAGA
jgi:RNA polymerase sigma-70 factor (ECF subfamily)